MLMYGCRKVLEVTSQSDIDQVESLRNAEAAASRTLATQSALKPINQTNSWWPHMSLWGPGGNKTAANKPAAGESPMKPNNGT